MGAWNVKRDEDHTFFSLFVLKREVSTPVPFNFIETRWIFFVQLDLSPGCTPPIVARRVAVRSCCHFLRFGSDFRSNPVGHEVETSPFCAEFFVRSRET